MVLKKVTALAMMVGLIGCAAGNGIGDALLKVDQGEPVESVKDVPKCQVDYSDFELDTQVLAFEVKDRWGASFGFDLLRGFFEVLGISIKLERGEMVMSMGLSEVTRPKEQVAYVMGRGASSKSEFRFKLDAIRLGTEIGYFRQTPMAALLEKTVRDSLAKLGGAMGSAGPWKSKAVHVEGDQIVIPSGHLAGIRPGDRFSVYNVELVWEGAPCESQLLLERKTTPSPLAEVEAMQVENNAALLRVVSKDSRERIQVGARVEIAQLTSGQLLARPARIREVKSIPLELPTGLKFDVTNYLLEQLRASLSEYGFQYRP